MIAANYDITNSPLNSSLLSPVCNAGLHRAPELDAYNGTTQWVYDPEQGRLVRRTQVPQAA
jgi:hypothetical protein